jgi:hypothetical protein
MKVTWRSVGAGAIALMFAAGMAAAQAQAQDIVRVRGTIEAIDGSTLNL